jgi:regulator of extracellular matrix RemA (YlzA/DUF370 family)
MINLRFVDIGYENNVSVGDVFYFANYKSKSVKRKVYEAKERLQCIDATSARGLRIVVFLKNRHVILCALQCKTLKKSLLGKEDVKDE